MKFLPFLLLGAFALPASAQFGDPFGRQSGPTTTSSGQFKATPLGGEGSDIGFSDSVTTLVTAQTRPGQIIYLTPLGIGLETWNYPLRTNFLDVQWKDEALRMAYMDSIPPSSQGTHAGFEPAQSQPTPVLLLHGKNFGGFYWEQTIRMLTSAGYRVIVPDQIGFGKSSKPDLKYSFDLLADNTAKLLDKLEIPKVFVVGHSMGGMLATKFARKYPNRVAKLVLENPIGLEDYRTAIGPVSFEKLLQTELADTDSGKIRTFYKRYFVTWKPEYEQFVEIKSRVALSGEFPRFATATARTYQPIFEEPIVPDFPKLKVPTLLVIGQEDRTAVGRQYASAEVAKTLGNVPELARKAARTIPGAKLVEIAGAGHIPHLEKPLIFNDALLEFLKEAA